jgi:LmbE family N-acetylglucosaminyl deacetylase
MTHASTASLLVAAALLVPALGRAAPPRQPHAAALGRAIDRLSVAGNVLYIAAHPDDENTRLLAWLANDRLLRTAYLSLTRGDGGQNLIGSEQGPLLGLIRTQELLAARAVDGAEQLFTRARDFGYSKTADETLSIWNRDEILADVVLQIRRFKPDVIITRFPPAGGDTHGHHTASAMLALEAFRLAADPAWRPDQVKEAGTWQAKRIVWNRSLWGQKTTDDLSKFMRLDVGGYSRALGLSWGEMAATSRTMHKSQGFGAAATRGQGFEYFQVLAGEPAAASPFESVDATWARVPGGKHLAELIAVARAHYQPGVPEASIPILSQAAAELDRLPPNPWKDHKKQEIDQVILACAGLFVEVTAAAPSTSAGAELPITATLIARTGAPVRARSLELPGGARIALDQALVRDEPLVREAKLAVPADAPVSNPYWLDRAPLRGMYESPDPSLIGAPEQPPPLVATLTVDVDGRAIAIRRPIAFKWVDPVAGERYRDVEVLPRVTIDPAAPVSLFPDGKPRDLRVTLRAHAASAGAIKAEAPAGFIVSPSEIPFDLAAGADREVAFRVTPPAAAKSAEALLRFAAFAEGKRYDRSLQRIEHAHIPIQTLLPPAEVKLVRFDLQRKRTRIGYIPGAGDEVAPALRQVGYEVTILTDEALRDRPLAPYEAIVTGVRAFNVNPRLREVKKKLLDWVAAGGTLVVQYNTNNRIAKAPPDLGPLPFEITQERVTDENAAVTFDLPDHPILARPNRISAADFEGWIQERGLYFADKFADGYQAPLALHDPGEPPRKGALIVARHGKGVFLYTGLAFFRQLPAGVPGAFRLFANLLAHGAR